MLVYRLFPYLSTAPAGQPGHPLYEHHPQSGGRIDHPDYYVWYLARQPEAAVGEMFGNLTYWTESMFEFPLIPGSRRSLGVYRLPDDVRILDLDDPAVLARLGLRPTQVVTRNLPVTESWGHRIWEEADTHDRSRRQWQAISWWSYYHPSWTVIGSWEKPELEEVTPINLGHIAVREAASTLVRPLSGPQ